MLTVLAENKNHSNIRAILDFPASDGKIAEFRKELDIESDAEISIRYAGTGNTLGLDAILLGQNDAKKMVLDELNLLSYLLDRMDEEQLESFDETMSEYTIDSFDLSTSSIFETAYGIIYLEDEEYSNEDYDRNKVLELLSAERELLKPYPEMNKDVFWQMITDAREQCGGDFGIMELSLTEELSRMSPQDIILYRDIKDEYAELADTNGIIKIAYDLNKGMLTDNGFTNFRCWLISQGREVYMSTLENPDISFLKDLKPVEQSFYQWETFGYAAGYAYEIKTGDELYDQEPIITQEQKDEIAAEVMCGGSSQEQTGGDSQFEQTM
ncbi:MAG: DUF4240 domain-containing protein [Oscillospiraceae bacterium]|nr:DUF4240 domain-containing protein [Oscillospiraceae bacterium]